MELSRHEVAEEMVVYPAIRTDPGGDVIADARRTEELMGAGRDPRSAVMDHAAREERSWVRSSEASAPARHHSAVRGRFDHLRGASQVA